MARGVWLQGHTLLRGAGGQARPASVVRERRLRIWRHDVGAHDGLLRLRHTVRARAPARCIARAGSTCGQHTMPTPLQLHMRSDSVSATSVLQRAHHRAHVFRDDVDAPSVQQGLRAAEERFVWHPDFPNLPASVPLTYVLAMKACLCDAARERPSFTDLATLLEDCSSEVLSGEYTNSEGNVWVRS
jgi:hypothetical protein